MGQTNVTSAGLRGVAPGKAVISDLLARLGFSDTEGLTIKQLDQKVVVSIADNPMSTAVPSGAVIIGVFANAETLITGAGGATAFGIGDGTDPDKYGESSVLAKNTKVTTIPDWVVLSSSETLSVHATNGAGAETGTIVGTVRVKVVYIEADALDDAE